MSGNTKKVHKPIFIVGCGRSGTTMLFDLLSKHPELVRTTGYPDGEDHEGWIKHGKCVMAGIGSPGDIKFGNGINGFQYCLHMTQDDVTDEIVGNMHQYYFDDVLGGNAEKRVLNKPPHLSNKLDYLLGIFQDAQIIHIIRDTEPMVASWMAVMDEVPNLMVYLPPDEEFPCLWLMQKPEDPVAMKLINRHPQFHPGGAAHLWTDYWTKTNAGILKQMDNKRDQLLSIRYEDLINEPRKISTKLLEFCELPEFEFSFDHFQRNTAAKHTNRMTREQAQAVREQASPIRKVFGYDGSRSQLAWSLYLP